MDNLNASMKAITEYVHYLPHIITFISPLAQKKIEQNKHNILINGELCDSDGVLYSFACFKYLLRDGLSEPEFYGDLVRNDFSFLLVRTGASCLLLGQPGFNWCFSFAPVSVSYSAPRDLHRRAAYSICCPRF